MAPNDLFSTRAIDRFRTSADASHFLLIPEAVATPKNADEVAQLFRYATTNDTSITFRSGGTSLSGQSVTDAILIDTRKHFRKIEVLAEGELVKVQPGATVRAVNARLARYGKKLGPDPASEIACTMGGVIANNSSGMACGISQNTYRTLKSATVVLANGTLIDTASPDAERELESKNPQLFHELIKIKEEVSAKPDLIAKIKNQYQIKNTMGYGLNSIIDFESVIDIFLHLLVGSEGTLGFVSEAIFYTVPLLPHAITTLLIFPNLIKATEALDALMTTEPTTIELMDSASLRAGKVFLGEVTIHEQAALLVEYQREDPQSLHTIQSHAQGLIDTLDTVNKPTLASDATMREQLWHIRKGLYATVAGARKSGTTALLEDIAVPVHQLADTCVGLQSLFEKYGYLDAVIFGHAKDGNIHFLLNEDFSDALKAERYRTFTEEMVNLILAKSGSLKAEHGTGRMMAPFVERQFGGELYGYMKRIKRAFDPENRINPGVLISNDTMAHMKNIKFNPQIEQIADNCVECGYCEPICPSKDLTTTPRQRIVIRRAIESARSSGERETLKELLDDSTYEVTESCATDGLCASSCPLGINTGALVKGLRADTSLAGQKRIWDFAAHHWSKSLDSVGALLTFSSRAPRLLIKWPNSLLRALFGSDAIPLWSNDLPRGGRKRQRTSSSSPDFVLFTSCLDSMFASETATSFRSLALKANLSFTTPLGIEELCCGTPWKSKGYLSGYETMVKRTYEALLAASDQGRLHIVCENSSCSEGLIEALGERSGHRLKIIDAVDFASEYLLPKLKVTAKLNSVALHPTCSSSKLGSNENLQFLAHAISNEVTIPFDWGCCAFAGDRGLLHPELTKSATAPETASLAGIKYEAYLSTNLTCEIGMSRATGENYEHILCQLDRLTVALT